MKITILFVLVVVEFGCGYDPVADARLIQGERIDAGAAALDAGAQLDGGCVDPCGCDLAMGMGIACADAGG